jgi:hypothetical protein
MSQWPLPQPKKGVAPGVIKGVFEVFPKQVKKIIFTCITCTGNYTWSCDVLFEGRVRLVRVY